MKRTLLNDFLMLCDIFQDDVTAVAKMVTKHHTPTEKESRVIEDFNEWTEIGRLERYEGTISSILDMRHTYVKQCVSCYCIASLIDDDELECEEIDYKEVVRMKKHEARSHFVQSLFTEIND